MYKNITRLILFIFIFNFSAPVLALDGNSSSTAISSPVQTIDFVGDPIVEDQYKLGPGDELAVDIIIGNNDMSIDQIFTVGPDGKIFFPRIGEMNVLGKTIPEVRSMLDEKLRLVYKEKYVLSFRLHQPRKVQIYLSGAEEKPLYVIEKKFVYVYGEVNKIGRFEFLPNKKFSDYISYAGGPTARANLSAASLTRGDKKYGINGSDVIFDGDSDKDMEIMPGDVINIPGQFFYFSDFGSFANLIFTMLALYTTFFK